MQSYSGNKIVSFKINLTYNGGTAVHINETVYASIRSIKCTENINEFDFGLTFKNIVY